jgi:hypothetical protein
VLTGNSRIFRGSTPDLEAADTRVLYTTIKRHNSNVLVRTLPLSGRSKLAGKDPFKDSCGARKRRPAVDDYMCQETAVEQVICTQRQLWRRIHVPKDSCGAGYLYPETDVKQVI